VLRFADDRDLLDGLEGAVSAVERVRKRPESDLRGDATYTPADLIDGRCPIHETIPEEIEEKNYFFRLSAYEDRLRALYDERPDLVLPQFRANEARSFVDGGLRDFSISRAGETWGIPLPWDEGQVAYVWADALVNYLSALTYARPGEDLRPVFWPAVRHVMAKDILRFHCVYWPAMLMSAGYEVPQQMFVHGYLILEGRGMSKSLGNVISPGEVIDLYGVDTLRFWAMRSVSFGQDGSVSRDSIRERYERDPFPKHRLERRRGGAEPGGQDQVGDQRDEGRHHEHVAMGEIDHADDAEHHRIADGDQAVDRTERDAVDELLDEVFHASAALFRIPLKS